MKQGLVLPLVGALWACPMGPSAGSFRPAHSPRGVIATVKFEHSKGQLRGELLELRDSTLLLLRDTARVVVVQMRAIRSASFRNLGTVISHGEMYDSDRERLRLMSRFPDGLRPEIAAQLLSAYGQTTPDVVTSP